eukprot:4481984-Prymnesium_polylepis.1
MPDTSLHSRELVLLGSHLRSNGSSDPHNCAVCLNMLKFNTNHGTPDWAQCPACQDVVHLSCLSKWIDSSKTDTFSCPSCRTKFDIDKYEADDLWNANDIVEKLQEELDPSFSDAESDAGDGDSSDNSASSSASSAADSDDDESDEESDEESDGESDDCVSAPAAKRTRSASAPQPLPRTRSQL